MTDLKSKEIRSEITSEGKLNLSIATLDVPTPSDDEVLMLKLVDDINSKLLECEAK